MTYDQLNREQRYTIVQLHKQGRSLRSITRTIEVHVSTVSRELRRNSHKRGYSAQHAQMLADERVSWWQHPRRFTRSLQECVASLLKQEQWSPELISGRLRLEGIAMVGKTTIYNWLHADNPGGGDLYSYSRHGLKYGHKRLSDPRNSKKRGRYKGILDRPEIIDVQGRMRDMKMDLILGVSSSEAILTLTDRKTDYIFLEALPHGRKAKPIARAVNCRLAFLKRRGQLYSITTDNSPEFSAFRSIERGSGVLVYFARPYRSTDKPHIEHANALIRQYLPKHSSFDGLTKGDLKEIEWRLNNRPRKKLDCRTPHEVFYLNLKL
jgi:transposase for insertion sequence element IS4351